MNSLLKKFYTVSLTLTLSLGLMSCDEEEKKAKGDPSKNHIANIETNKGTFKFTLHEDKTPITTKNFIDLANKGFYNGLTFHRYEPGFVIQGGDPKGNGTGGSEKTIPLEIDKSLSHIEGALGMARSQDPNSASSQFYVTLAPSPHLDGGYCVFGQVTEGMDVVKELRAGDKMIKVTIKDNIKK
jgi:peptidyl-prolyl cis-trans isomerase B (cyclophilin B)